MEYVKRSVFTQCWKIHTADAASLTLQLPVYHPPPSFSPSCTSLLFFSVFLSFFHFRSFFFPSLSLILYISVLLVPCRISVHTHTHTYTHVHTHTAIIIHCTSPISTDTHPSFSLSRALQSTHTHIDTYTLLAFVSKPDGFCRSGLSGAACCDSKEPFCWQPN